MAVCLAAALPALFWLQMQLPDGGLSLAFRPAALWRGEGWATLFTSMFIHGGWRHVMVNALVALIFGPPVARLMTGARGVAGFLGFYIVCGLLGASGYALVYPSSLEPVGGASAAVSGLVGSALRLVGRREGEMAALADRRFLAMAGAVMALIVISGLLSLGGDASGARTAWEAHAFGFVAGGLLIGPWARALRSRPTSFDSSSDLRDPWS